MSARMKDTTSEQTCVLYNADCPVCSYEINHYAAYSNREELSIRFDDLNDQNALGAWGLDADTAARRLHVLKDGNLLSGIDAFLVLWTDMPRYRVLARIVSVPGVYHVACAAYDHILAPLIYRWHIRRLNKTNG